MRKDESHSSDLWIRTNFTVYYYLVHRLIRELLNKLIDYLQLQQTGNNSNCVESISSTFASFS